jgi:hypothetical protein
MLDLRQDACHVGHAEQDSQRVPTTPETLQNQAAILSIDADLRRSQRPDFLE